MTDIFTASNGITIEVVQDEYLIAKGDADATYATAGPHGIDALAEWYQHRRDQELGRWRDPETGLLVYPDHKYNVAYVLDEELAFVTFHKNGDNRSTHETARAARRYFDAHPEPKPWHSAAEGDIWLLDGPEHPGELRPYLVSIDTDGEKSAGPRFFSIFRLGWTPGSLPNEFTAGRRIWPEESRDE